MELNSKQNSICVVCGQQFCGLYGRCFRGLYSSTT